MYFLPNGYMTIHDRSKTVRNGDGERLGTNGQKQKRLR
jgi:hypothetical protein